MSPPRKISLAEWDARHAALLRQGLKEPCYGGTFGRHVTAGGDLRLLHLEFDDSVAALRLWNFLLTENERLITARSHGEKLVGTMKDLGTVPVMAYALPGMRAFYPDGAWWTPCLMQCSDRLLEQADKLGIDAMFCPVRAMLPAFLSGEHFPVPDLLVCSTGAICDDFSAIAQRLARLGHSICWWEIPRRREPEPPEAAVMLPGGVAAPASQVRCVSQELARIAGQLGQLAGCCLTEVMLAKGISQANRFRQLLSRVRRLGYQSTGATMPALEMLIAEMLAIHFCSDREEAVAVLSGLLDEMSERNARGWFYSNGDAIRVYWVNPVADLRAMNLLEQCGGRIVGTDYMFSHALDLIPEELPPLEALARVALADPMVGSALDRGRRIIAECKAQQAQAVVISRVPGASHCAREGTILRDLVRDTLGLPCVEIEVPPVCDSFIPSIRSRLEALMETARLRSR